MEDTPFHDKDGLSSPSVVSSDSIEMTNFDEITVTPNPRNNYCPPYIVDHHDDDDAEEGEDEDRMALLNSGDRSHSVQLLPDHTNRLWPQVKRIVLETAPTLLVTTVGLLFTGEILNNVSHWKAMSRIDELIMLVPVILNLKGNLEMNLSARLGTAANMGELDKPDIRRAIIRGNLTLLQVQATVVSAVAACVAFGLGRIITRPPPLEAGTAATFMVRSSVYHSSRIPRPTLPNFIKPSGPGEFMMVAASAMSSTCLSSILLGSFMCGLVVLCRRFGLDPDNIAPPVAACLGDLVTLCLLGVISTAYLFIIDTIFPILIVAGLIVSAVFWTFVTRKNPHVSNLLTQGWVPLFVAMIISCGTGIVLDLFASRYEGFALLAVVISGLPGSVGSIFVSRLSTAFHSASLSLLPASSDDFTQKVHPPTSPRLVMVTLLFVTFPIEIIFLTVLRVLGWLHLPAVFMVLSVFFFCIAVVASLFLARGLTTLLWKRNLDPDMYALPIQSALVDLIGQLLLVVCFELVSLMGLPVKSTPGR